MQVGCGELGRRWTAKATGIAFAITYLWASACGADGMTSLVRSAIAALCTLVVAFVLVRPVADVVLDAFARDEAKRREQAAKEGDA
jgi:quinol-cytochrome oxidoreductase complex cytochrome b subunit